ncbi:response regulator [Tritonibacter sp. SIMBA_163]
MIPADDILDLENRPDAFSDVLPVMPVMDVLVVDDNKTNRFILEKFLSSSSCRVQSVSSGAEAIELARDLAFDIILMDIQMPGMDGVETTRRIRSLEQAGGREPGFIVAVTANTMPEQSAHYLSAGMDEVLAKPVSKEPFLKMIQTVRRKVAQCAEDKAALPR